MGGGEDLPRNPRLARQRFAPGASLQWDDGKRCQFGLCAPRSLAAATGEVMRSERRVIIIAGPNGAGKTTFAREFLPHEADCPVFVNADLIAAGLAPFAPATAAIQAGRLMLAELDRHFAAGRSFAFETTLSGRNYVHRIKQWQQRDYRVKLIFLRLASADEAVARVAQRVRQGGHDVPAEVIRRRFAAGLHHFVSYYAPLVDAWSMYDNSGAEPRLLDWKENR